MAETKQILNPATGALETPSSVTEQGPASTRIRGSSKKDMSPAAWAEFQKWRAAQSAQQAALASPAASPDIPTGEDVAGQMSADAEGAMATPKLDQPVSADPAQRVLDQLSGKTPQVGDISAPESPRYTAQQLAQQPAMQTPRTMEAAADEAAKDEARYKAKVASETQDQLRAIEAQKAQRLQAAQQQYEQMAQQLTRTGQVQAFAPTMAQRFAIALGSFGAGLTGGPNFAQQMMEKQMQLDADRQHQQLNIAMERLKMAGANPQQIMEFAQHQTMTTLAMQKAKLDTFHEQVNKILAPFPQFQQAANQKLAEMQAKQAQDAAKQLADATGRTVTSNVSNESSRTTTVNATAKGEGKSPGQAVVADRALADAKKNLAQLKGMSDEQYAKLTTEFARAKAHAAKLDQEFGGDIGERASASIQQDILGAPKSGYDAAREVAGPEGEALMSRDANVTSAVVAMTNPRAAANPEILAKIAENKGATAQGLSRAEAIRRAAAQVDVLSAESSRNAPMLNKVAARQAASAATSTAAPQGMTGQQFGKLTAAEKNAYTEARLEKPGSKDYAEAQAAIRSLTRKATGTP